MIPTQTITLSKAEYASLKQEVARLRAQAEQAAAKYEQVDGLTPETDFN